jgi:uncharacterized protein (DUF362 family)
MRSKVVLVRHKNIFDNRGGITKSKVAEALDAGLKALTGDKDPRDSLRSLFDGSGAVALKLNCLSGRMLSTAPELAFSLAEELSSIGIKKSDIIIWERTERELASAGYTLSTRGSDFRVLATDSSGAGYSRSLFVSGKVGSLLSRIMTDIADFAINLPILKDHNLAGLSGGMKNYYGAIHNPNKFHDNNCDPYVADVNAFPDIKNKNRLTVCDCTRVQYHGGPGYKPQWCEKFGGILLSKDPVALDRIAYNILEDLRRKNGLGSLEEEGREPKYMFTAGDDEHKLGSCSIEEIDFVEVTLP